MKAATFAFLASTALGAAIERRANQDGPHGAVSSDLLKGLIPAAGKPFNLGALGAGMMPPLKMAGRTTAEPQLRKNSKRTITKYGPYVVIGQGVPNRPRGFSLDPKGQSFFNIIDDVCAECTILAGSTGLVFEDGSPAGPEQGMYIHHILTSDINKKGVTPVSPCDQDTVDPNNLPKIPPPPGAGFIGQGEDNGKSPIYFTTPDGSYDSGFHVKANDKFSVMADLVNYANETRNVYLTWDIEYLDGIHGQDSTPNLMSVTGCKMKQPNISKDGPAHTVSKLFPVLIDGTITAAKGHMHNGGVAMIMRLNGKEICVSKPNYEGDNIQGMSDCNLNIKIKKGDAMQLESIYDLKAHPLRKGVDGMAAHDMMGGDDVMGMATLSFAIDP